MKKSRMIAAAAIAAVSASALAVSAGAYNAYIGLQSNNYSFRNSWSEANYGKATPYFNSWIVWGNKDKLDETYPEYAEYYDFDLGTDGGYLLPASYKDAAIDTDGTYTVAAEGIDFGIRSDDIDFNLVFISTDIPANLGAKITDVKVSVDGNVVKTVDEATYDETVEYIQVDLANIYNNEVGGWGLAYPTKSIAIEFTVSGLNGGAADTAADVAAAEETTAAPAEETNTAPASETPTTTATAGDTTAATNSSKGSPNTGIADVAVIAGLAVAAGAGIVLTRKRK